MKILIKSIMQANEGFSKKFSKDQNLATQNNLKPKTFYGNVKGLADDVVEISFKANVKKISNKITLADLQNCINQNMTLSEVALYFNKRKSTISGYLRRYGLASKIKPEISEDVLREQIAQGLSLPQLAKLNNCPQAVVRARLKALNLQTLEAERVASIPVEDLLRLVNKGWECKDIARKYKVSELQIGRLLKRYGIETDIEKITKMITKQDILDMYEAGVDNNIHLAEIFGIPEFVLGNILHKFDLVDKQYYLSRLANDQVVITYDELSKMVGEGWTKSKIAEHFGVTHSRITKYLDEYGLSAVARPKKAKDVLPDNFTLSQILKKGATLEEIAEDYEISMESLKNHLKKAGIVGYQKEEMPYEKLENLVEEGYLPKEIAKTMNLPLRMVFKEIRQQGLELNATKEKILNLYKQWVLEEYLPKLGTYHRIKNLQIYMGLDNIQYASIYEQYGEDMKKILNELEQSYINKKG